MNKAELQSSIDELKAQITAIQKAVQEIKQTGLNIRVIEKSLQTVANRHLEGRYNNPISIKVVRAVLEGIEELKEYMFPKDKP